MLMLVQAARASLIQGPVTRSASLRVGLVEGSAINARAAIHLGRTCCSTPIHELPKECCLLKICLLCSAFEAVPARTMRCWHIM